MNKTLSGLVLMALCLWGCQKTEIIRLDLEGTLKGTIYSNDEFGHYNEGTADVFVELEGSEPRLSTTTNADGSYELDHIPTGTYNIILYKEGYARRVIEGYKIVGGNEPLRYNSSISQISTTTVENLSLEIGENDQIFLKALIHHNFTIVPGSLLVPNIRYYVHTDGHPSGDHYLNTRWLTFEGESGTEINKPINLPASTFPSGTKIYVIAYGALPNDVAEYDPQLDLYISNTHGVPSNIASITVP